MLCTPQIFEKSARVCNYYGIYLFKVHVHCIVFVTILYYGMYVILVNIDQNQEINDFLVNISNT